MVIKLTIISCYAAALLFVLRWRVTVTGTPAIITIMLLLRKSCAIFKKTSGVALQISPMTRDAKRGRRLLSIEQAIPRRPARLDGDPCPVTIETVVAVITKSNGAVGSLSAGEIADQIDVMNDAFAPAGFVFNLREPPHYYDNAAWYSDCGTNEADMKTTIRKDIDPSDTGNKKDVLYIYICVPGSKLGYGTLPFP